MNVNPIEVPQEHMLNNSHPCITQDFNEGLEVA